MSCSVHETMLSICIKIHRSLVGCHPEDTVLLPSHLSGVQWCLFFFNICRTSPTVSLAGAATSIIFVATNTCLLRQLLCLSQQKQTCHNQNMFVATKKTCFVLINTFVLSRQKRYLRQLPPVVPLCSLLMTMFVNAQIWNRMRPRGRELV